MGFYNNFFASYYYLFQRFNNFNPIHSSKLLVTACQYMHFFLLSGIAEKLTGTQLIPQFQSKYYVLFFAIPWFIIVYLYYSKNRVDQILKGFNQKSQNVKIIWGVVSVVSVILPIILFPILFSKPHPDPHFFHITR
jgi:membrane protease YdiL (CAAX protease family)